MTQGGSKSQISGLQTFLWKLLLGILMHAPGVEIEQLAHWPAFNPQNFFPCSRSIALRRPWLWRLFLSMIVSVLSCNIAGKDITREVDGHLRTVPSHRPAWSSLSLLIVTRSPSQFSPQWNVIPLVRSVRVKGVGWSFISVLKDEDWAEITEQRNDRCRHQHGTRHDLQDPYGSVPPFPKNVKTLLGEYWSNNPRPYRSRS